VHEIGAHEGKGTGSPQVTDLLTTDAVEAHERFAYWRELICAVYVQLDAKQIGTGAFSGAVSVSSLGGLSLSRVRATGQVVTRQPSEPGSDCLVSVQVSGIGRITQFGRTAELQPGDFALYDATAPYELFFDRPFEQIVLKFPREVMTGRNVHIRSAAAVRCSGDTGAGAIASSFIRSLASHDAEVVEVVRGRMGEQALDCVATSLATMAGSTATHEAVHEFNRRRVLNYVEQHLRDPSLSVTSAAAHLGVSARTIQKLFADDELHLSERIKSARLQRAASALRDPLLSHATITSIAADVGFTGPETFSRSFRDAYGCTPREYRQQTNP
jgi:AraC-like DNA-binding protein